MALIVKSQDDLTNDTVSRLTGLGYTDAQYSGTGARNILDVIDSKLADFYGALKSGAANLYISQASGATLDSIGALVGCFRRAGEQDPAFQARTSVAYQSQAGTTATALISNLLTLANVRDVIAVPYVGGAGTISYYLLPIQAPISQDTIDAAQSMLSSQAAGGVVCMVLTPRPLYVNLTGSISWKATPGSPGTASTAMQTYIANLTMGSALILDQVISAGLTADTTISDITLLTLSLTDGSGNTTEQVLANYTPLFDQELYAGTISLS